LKQSIPDITIASTNQVAHFLAKMPTDLAEVLDVTVADSSHFSSLMLIHSHFTV